MSSNAYPSAGLRRRQFAKKLKWYIGITGGLLFIIGLAYLVIGSGLFSVKDRIEIIGVPLEQRDRILSVLRPQVLTSRLGGVLGADNFFSWSDSLVYEDVRSNRVSVRKSLLNRSVTVTVHPRVRYGIWCLESEPGFPVCSWTDKTGVVFEPAPIPDGQLIIAVFESATSTAPILGQPIMNEDQFEVVKKVAEALAVVKLPVNRITVDRSLEEVQLDTVNGAAVAFSLRFDPSTAALPALKKLIDFPGLHTMRTVDFTVENRVFYTAR